MAFNWRIEKGVDRVESYTIPYATLKRLRWCTLPAAKEAAYYTGVNVQSDHWTGPILRSSLYDLIDWHWFLWRYLVVFKVSFRNEVVTPGITATSALTSAECQCHTSSIWPWSGAPNVHLYYTFLSGLHQDLFILGKHLLPDFLRGFGLVFRELKIGLHFPSNLENSIPGHFDLRPQPFFLILRRTAMTWTR